MRLFCWCSGRQAPTPWQGIPGPLPVPLLPQRAGKGGGTQQAGGYRMEMGKCSQRRGSPGLAEPPMFLRGPPHPTGWPPPSTSMDKSTRPWRKLSSGLSRVYPALTVGSGVLQPVPETQFAPVTKVGERTRGRCTDKQAWRSGTARGTAAPRFRQAKFSCGYWVVQAGHVPQLGGMWTGAARSHPWPARLLRSMCDHCRPGGKGPRDHFADGKAEAH